MTAFGWQVTGLALLLATIALGFHVWHKKTAPRPPRHETLAALVLLATFAGGFWGAFAWWQNYPEAFSWALPGLGAKMLAVAGWSFAVASALALARPSAPHLRMVLWMLWVYLGPLTLAILTAHLGRFDFSRPVTIAFFVVVLLLLVSSTIALLWLPRPSDKADTQPSPLTRAVLAVIAGVAGIWAGLLFLVPDGPWPLIWPWPGDDLTTRLIASMFLSVALGAYVARTGRLLARTALWTTAAYGLGVVIAGFAHVMTAVPSEKGYSGISLPLSYMVVWGGLGAIAILALVASARPPRKH